MPLTVLVVRSRHQLRGIAADIIGSCIGKKKKETSNIYIL